MKSGASRVDKLRAEGIPVKPWHTVCETTPKWNGFLEGFSPVEPPTLSFLHSDSSTLMKGFNSIKQFLSSFS